MPSRETKPNQTKPNQENQKQQEDEKKDINILRLVLQRNKHNVSTFSFLFFFFFSWFAAFMKERKKKEKTRQKKKSSPVSLPRRLRSRIRLMHLAEDHQKKKKGNRYPPGRGETYPPSERERERSLGTKDRLCPADLSALGDKEQEVSLRELCNATQLYIHTYVHVHIFVHSACICYGVRYVLYCMYSTYTYCKQTPKYTRTYQPRTTTLARTRTACSFFFRSAARWVKKKTFPAPPPAPPFPPCLFHVVLMRLRTHTHTYSVHAQSDDQIRW